MYVPRQEVEDVIVQVGRVEAERRVVAQEEKEEAIVALAC
jgi:hypothetical protein